MECLSIGMIEEIEDIKDILYHTASDLQAKEIEIELKQKKANNVNYLDIEIHSENKLSNLKGYLANVIAQYIIDKYEIKFISRIINSNYCYFNAVERKEILKTSLKHVMETEEKNIFNHLFMLRRRNIISKKLIEYLETTNEIILDGFITFRLKEYISELEDIVDKAVDDYLMEKEYKEFIRLLKYFVEIQEPKIDIVHVLWGSDRKYILRDGQGKEITNECIKDFIREVSEGEINYDDLLVSSLITLAPNKIYIHAAQHITNKELMETIKNVFLGKVVVCGGCDICTTDASNTSESKIKEFSISNPQV